MDAFTTDTTSYDGDGTGGGRNEVKTSPHKLWPKILHHVQSNIFFSEESCFGVERPDTVAKNIDFTYAALIRQRPEFLLSNATPATMTPKTASITSSSPPLAEAAIADNGNDKMTPITIPTQVLSQSQSTDQSNRQRRRTTGRGCASTTTKHYSFNCKRPQTCQNKS